MTFVVTIQKGEDGRLLAHLSRSAFKFDEADVVRSIPLDISALPMFDTREHAECYGRALQGALGSHPAIQQVLNTLYQAPPGTPATLMFEIRVPIAEALRWETLCHDNLGFATVNIGANVARVAAHATAVRTPPRALSWPIRIAAFLSPAGVSSKSEMDEIIAAVTRARKSGLACALHLYLGESKLISDIEKRVTAGTLKGVEVSPIPAQATDFERIIRDTTPDVLHFFCHGLSQSGLQYIEFATIADWEAGNASGSSRLSINRLTNMAGLRRCWLTVLNCCHGAGALDQAHSLDRAHSMAYSVVVDGGCPAAVGMNESIEVVDAVAFAKVFYDKLLNECFESLKCLKAGDHVDLDLTPVVKATRMDLYQTYDRGPADAFGRWSLPVLYVSDDPLRIAHVGGDNDPATNREIEQKAELISKLLRELPIGAPANFRKRLQELLDHDPIVPPSMRPDGFGIFPV